MYRNVYFHKVVRSAEGMVKLALQRAKRLAVQGRLPWPPRDHAVYKSLMGQRLSIEEFTDLDDISVLHCFKLWATAEDAELASLCHGLLFRRLYKTIDLSHLSADEASAAAQRATQAITEAGGDSQYALFYDQPDDEPHEAKDHAQSPAGLNIAVLRPDGSLADLGDISPLPAALHKQLQFRRLHVHEQWKSTALAAVDP
jgi:HD superfamily phosphohydrolase